MNEIENKKKKKKRVTEINIEKINSDSRRKKLHFRGVLFCLSVFFSLFCKFPPSFHFVKIFWIIL